MLFWDLANLWLNWIAKPKPNAAPPLSSMTITYKHTTLHSITPYSTCAPHPWPLLYTPCIPHTHYPPHTLHKLHTAHRPITTHTVLHNYTCTTHTNYHTHYTIHTKHISHTPHTTQPTHHIQHIISPKYHIPHHRHTHNIYTIPYTHILKTHI